MPNPLKAARRAISKQFNTPDRPNIHAVYVGLKEKGGKETGETAIVVHVHKKMPLAEVPERDRIPKEIDGVQTDVREAPMYKALALLPQATKQELTQRKRPCPGGFSVGHKDITAGTLGTWVLKNGQQVILSNNHVLANSNAAQPGDAILQPGPYDGGRNPQDQIATLLDYVHINMDGEEPPPDDGDGDPDNPKKNKDTMRHLQIGLKHLVEGIARANNCPARVKFFVPHRITQPSPNLVDAALAKPTSGEVVDDTVYRLGATAGVRDPKLNDTVRKSGRTTETTSGRVVGIDADVAVDYGDGKVAQFERQTIIRAASGNFSAGGDSGSAILSEDNFFVGLLFAGGGRDTIANRASDVVSLLGIAID